MNTYEEIKEYFSITLDRCKIPAYQVYYYHKWLKYYLHFCAKYRHDDKHSKSLPLWIAKLKQRNQTDFQIKQAAHAVNIYYTIKISTDDTKRDENNDSWNNNSEKSKKQEVGEWQKVFLGLEKEIKLRNYSRRTLEVYTMWARRFKGFLKSRPPEEITSKDAKKYLEYLAVTIKVAGSTQNQAFNALLFLFRHVLKKEYTDLNSTIRAKKSHYIPAVLSKQEVRSVFENLLHPHKLMAQLSYGCGLRISEAISLRVKDIDFDNKILFIRQAKGQKDRTVPLPQSIVQDIKAQVAAVKKMYDDDTRAGFAGTFLMDKEDNKFKHRLKDFAWYWLFPAKNLVRIPAENVFRRYHTFPTIFQKAIRDAVNRAGINKRVTPHTLRHSFATHLLQEGYDIQQVQNLMGHASVKTTMIYLHLIQSEVKTPQSPLDFLYIDKRRIATV